MPLLCKGCRSSAHRYRKTYENPYIFSYTTPTPPTGAPIPSLIPGSHQRLPHQVAFSTALANFVLSIFPWILSSKSTTTFQFVDKLGWIPFANIDLYIGIDGIPLFFISLTTLPIPIRILISRNSVKIYVKEYMIRFPPPELLPILVSSVSDPVLFHIFLESILIPMFIIIGVRGSRERKIGAAYQSFPYTPPGPVFPPIATPTIHPETGTTDTQTPPTTESPFNSQIRLRLAFLASLAAKVPMIPVHTRPPEAHAEAPTAGPATPAGAPPKLGGHGSPRPSIPTPPEAPIPPTPFVHAIRVIAIIYISLTTLRQVDLKKIIAHPPVAHMAFVILGVFTYNLQAIEGSILLMLSHGVVPGALPMRVGVPHDRHKTRVIRYYPGMIQVMPLFMAISPIPSPANPSPPTTGGPIGEFSVIVGLFQANKMITFLAPTGMASGAAYPIRSRNRTARGNPKVYPAKIFADMNHREPYMFLPLVFLTFLMGIHPEIIPDTLHTSVKNLIISPVFVSQCTSLISSSDVRKASIWRNLRSIFCVFGV